MEQLHLRKIKQTGTSLSVNIPANILREFDWRKGDFLVYTFPGGDAVTLRKVTDEEIRNLKDKVIKY